MSTAQQISRRARARVFVENRIKVWNDIDDGGSHPIGFDKDANPVVKAAQAETELANLKAKGA